MSSTPVDAGRRSCRRLVLLLAPIVAVSVAATVANWLAPALIVHHPLLEIALNPLIRYLALAATTVEAAAYYVVGFVRLLLTDPPFYLLGLWYGDAAVRWVERRLGIDPRLIGAVERWFSKASYAFVLIAPNGFVCLLAGAIRMRPLVFLTLNVAGTAGRLVLVRVFAEALRGPLEVVVDFIGRNQWWLLILSITLGAFQLMRARRSRRSTVASPVAMEREIESEAGDPGNDVPSGPT